MSSATLPPPTKPLPVPVVPPPPRDDRRYEFLNGQWVEKHVSTRSIGVASDIMALLAQHVRPIRAGRAIAECFFPIPGVKDPGRRRKPDAAFVSAARWPLDRELPDSDPWPVVPNLAVEGVSPTNNWTDLDDKVTEYFAAGVELLWVVYPGADRVYAYSSPNSVRILNRTDVLDAVPVLPDFRLPLVEVFGTTAD